MIIPLSAGMQNYSRNSNSSITESRGSGRKRSLPASGQSVRPDNSLSGYSADREDSSSSPPFSIDVSNETTHDNIRDMNSCPKRQKRHELQFAASSIKADLARAGYEFPTIDPTIENTTTLGPVSINLRGVKLVHSKAFQRIPKLVPCSAAASLYDYQALALACSDSYPSIFNRSTLTESNVTSSLDSVGSTSSVSESDTESVTSKGNAEDVLTINIPPLLKEEDVKVDTRSRDYEPSSYNIISSESSSISMSEGLALTKTPRVVALSCNPFAIVHANAAFLRLLNMPSEKIVGSGFTSITKSPCTNDDTQPPIFLSDYMLSSCSGNYRKVLLVDHKDELHPEPIERYLRVLPIVGAKTLPGSEVLNVSHFSVEFLANTHDNDSLSGSFGSPSSSEMSNIKRPSHDGDMAVGVMG